MNTHRRNTSLTPKTDHINVSPDAFRLWALDYFACYLVFRPPRKFSPVPFFLCCRAIELALKAKHLERKSREKVRKAYSHDLLKSYTDLEPKQRNLSEGERDLLAAANEIYKAKDFEYFNIIDAATAYKRFPDLESLGALARKILDYGT